MNEVYKITTKEWVIVIFGVIGVTIIGFNLMTFWDVYNKFNPLLSNLTTLAIILVLLFSLFYIKKWRKRDMIIGGVWGLISTIILASARPYVATSLMSKILFFPAYLSNTFFFTILLEKLSYIFVLTMGQVIGILIIFCPILIGGLIGGIIGYLYRLIKNRKS